MGHRNVWIKELAADVLSTPTLRPWMDIEVTALRPHPQQPR